MIEKLAIAQMTKLASNDFTGFGKKLGTEFTSGLGRQWQDTKGSFQRNILKNSDDKKWGAWRTLGNMASIGIPLAMLGLMGGRAMKGLLSRRAAPSVMGIKPSTLYAGVGGLGAMQYFGPKAAKKVGMGGMNKWDVEAYRAGLLKR